MNLSRKMAFAPRVLCVNDEPNTLKALEDALRRFGCEVLPAGDGLEALELVQSDDIQVLICDEDMPTMNGVELLHQARAVAPGTARVLLTAYCSRQEVVLPAVDEGDVFRLLSKPWQEDDLRMVVIEALGMEPWQWSDRQRRIWEGVLEGQAQEQVAVGVG
jgi:response regulator RpfG family c-di-GMP phosphodiesterase